MEDHKAAFNLSAEVPSKEDKRTFAYPDKFVRDEESGFSKVDPRQSETFILLEASDINNLDARGRPINTTLGKKVYYAQKANKYYKDPECTNQYTTQEISALGLPLPSAIEAARVKVMKEAFEQGLDISKEELYNATSPSILKPADFSNK